MKNLSFDRTAKCDWCRKRKLVAVTQYGTSHYNRLVCESCKEEIEKRDNVLIKK